MEPGVHIVILAWREGPDTNESFVAQETAVLRHRLESAVKSLSSAVEIKVQFDDGDIETWSGP